MWKEAAYWPWLSVAQQFGQYIKLQDVLSPKWILKAQNEIITL